MNNDFHDHLDAARLWWGLDDAVLEAIADGRSTEGAYASMARYVLGLKRASEAPAGLDDTASLMKIGLRLANTPEISADGPRPPLRVRALRATGMVILVAIALAALLTAGAAANVISVPQPVRNMLRKIGVDIEAAKDPSRPASEYDTAERDPHHNHLHSGLQVAPEPLAPEGSAAAVRDAADPAEADRVIGAPVAPGGADERGDGVPDPRGTPAPEPARRPEDGKPKKKDRGPDYGEERGWGIRRP